MNRPQQDRAAGNPGVEVGDTIFANHNVHGILPVTVVSVGRDGCFATGPTGERHAVPWSAYISHKHRAPIAYHVVDQGADGSIVADDRGRRRYLHGEIIDSDRDAAEEGQREEAAREGRPWHEAEMDEGAAARDRLEKALTREIDPFDAFLKAQEIANRPGLALQQAQSRTGGTIRRWKRTTADQPQQRQHGQAKPDQGQQRGQQQQQKPQRLMRHGETVKFRHGNVEGSGKIVASGPAGVTVKDEDGREHRVRHEALVHPDTDKPVAHESPQAERPNYAPREHGEADKAYAKRVIDKGDGPKSLPEDHAKYFNTAGAQMVPIDKLVSGKSDEENAQGSENGPKRMQAAAHGVLSKRDPIKVRKREDGSFTVVDGNGTLASAKKLGWKSLPVTVEGDDAGEPKPGAEAPTGGEQELLFHPDEVAKLPQKARQSVSDKTELFQKSADALEHLQTWLDKGRGVASKMGYQTMKGSPEDADLKQKGGMLFIAPLKGDARASQKVRDKYGGDWTRLTDVTRCTIAVDTMDEVRRVIQKLKENGMQLAGKPDDHFAQPTDAHYRDLNLNVRFPNGIVGEIQVHLKGILEAKNVGHKFYEAMRTVAEKKPEDRTPEDTETWENAMVQSRKLYDSAWANATGGEQTLTKALDQPKGAPKEQTEGADQSADVTYFDHDGATFRRKGEIGGVDDVLAPSGMWVPYEGDKLEPVMFGKRIAQPDEGGTEDILEKSNPVLLFKARTADPRQLSLLPTNVVHVAGHTRDGHYVAPYEAPRHVAAATVAQPQPTAAERLRQIMRLDRAQIDAYDPAAAPTKVGRRWSFDGVRGTSHPGIYETKRDAIAAATRHRDLLRDEHDNPTGFWDIRSIIAGLHVDLIEKYQREGMTEMDATARARAEIPEHVEPQTPHHYIPRLRPAGFATLPHGVKWDYVEAPQMEGLANRPELPRSRHRYGVISTDRALTDDELERHELGEA